MNIIPCEKLDNNLDSLEDKMDSQNQVIDWYIKLFYNKVTSPHNNIRFNEIDKEFILKHFKMDKEKKRIMNKFKEFVDHYEFEY